MATNPNPRPSPKPTVYLQDMEEVEIVFKRFDANDDGKISATELADVMKALGSETSTEEVSRMMEEIDTDQDGFINLKEFADFCKGGSAADGGAGEIKDAFEIYDQDKNGLISPNELRVVLNRLGEKFSEQDCSKMIKSVKSVDSDSDVNVNFDEFKKMMTNSTTGDGDTSMVKHMD